MTAHPGRKAVTHINGKPLFKDQPRLVTLERALGKAFGTTSRKPTVVDRPSKNAMARARRLAAKHDIEIERDCQGGWWVATALDSYDDSPLAGNHFCQDGQEVLSAVEIAVEFLATKGA